MTTLTFEYTAAIEVHNVAISAYRAVLVEYRAGNMSDDVFLAHRADKKTADAAFDKAFAAERDRDDGEIDEIIVSDGQYRLDIDTE